MSCCDEEEDLRQSGIIGRNLVVNKRKFGEVGSFVPDNAKATSEEFEREEVSDEIEEIFDEDTEFANDDEALAAMEFYDTSDDTE